MSYSTKTILWGKIKGWCIIIIIIHLIILLLSCQYRCNKKNLSVSNVYTVKGSFGWIKIWFITRINNRRGMLVYGIWWANYIDKRFVIFNDWLIYCYSICIIRITLINKKIEIKTKRIEIITVRCWDYNTNTWYVWKFLWILWNSLIMSKWIRK